MDRKTWERYKELSYLLEFSAPDSDEWMALSEDIACLPGHPKSERGDIIWVEVTSVQH
jgi:hypothetical protein